MSSMSVLLGEVPGPGLLKRLIQPAILSAAAIIIVRLAAITTAFQAADLGRDRSTNLPFKNNTVIVVRCK